MSQSMLTPPCLPTDHDHDDNMPSQAQAASKAALMALFVLPSDAHDESFYPGDQHTQDSGAKHSVAAQRLALYERQSMRTRKLYMAPTKIRPTYLVQTLKPQFIEYQQYKLARRLDKRGLINTDAQAGLWQQLHVIDDIISDIVRAMPAQRPAGWQLSIQDGHNLLCLPTIGKLSQNKPISDQGSLISYVLCHFGVTSFTYDRGYFIGHVIGYLFCCYFCAHLSISYSVRALDQHSVAGFDYASLETPYMVRLLQGLDGYCKKRVYQLAVICARLSLYHSDKRIEKLLIAEVNDFDKKIAQQHLDVLLLQGMMPDSDDPTPLF